MCLWYVFYSPLKPKTDVYDLVEIWKRFSVCFTDTQGALWRLYEKQLASKWLRRKSICVNMTCTSLLATGTRTSTQVAGSVGERAKHKLELVMEGKFLTGSQCKRFTKPYTIHHTTEWIKTRIREGPWSDLKYALLSRLCMCHLGSWVHTDLYACVSVSDADRHEETGNRSTFIVHCN